jgi:nucleotide-binding universal stress UspA family protein
MNTIIVGYDNSSGSQLALRWAAAEAALRGSELEILTVHNLPLSVEAMYTDLEEQLRQQAEQVTAGGRDLVRDDYGDAIKVRTTVVSGPPAAALIDAARDAEVLVVGSRGHGAFASMLLGSVSLHCVTHAPCPVVVVRDMQHGPPLPSPGQPSPER